ncbi:hypothetical protein [Streptomyces adustus]|uniref:hypothetical protein n=1 Tax=Streptomyces adustus TaxID=1609272 RepID=UPI003722DA24
MRATTRVYIGAATAALLTACLAGPASADDATDSPAAANLAAFQAHVAANEAAPVSVAEAASHTETKAFMAAAKSNGESTAHINSLLTSGKWVAYPVTLTFADTSDNADPEKAHELTAAQALAAAPDADEAAEAAKEAPSDVAAETADAVAASRVKCWTPSGTVTLKNAFGSKIWWYRVGEHNCYDWTNVVSYDREPNIDHKVYEWAQSMGWSWEGPDLTGTKGPSYYKFHGRSHGAVQVWRKGSFKYDPIGVFLGPKMRYPWLHLYIHDDGFMKYTYGM